jgi:hypothetical protein
MDMRYAITKIDNVSLCIQFVVQELASLYLTIL